VSAGREDRKVALSPVLYLFMLRVCMREYYSTQSVSLWMLAIILSPRLSKDILDTLTDEYDPDDHADGRPLFDSRDKKTLEL